MKWKRKYILATLVLLVTLVSLVIYMSFQRAQKTQIVKTLQDYGYDIDMSENSWIDHLPNVLAKLFDENTGKSITGVTIHDVEINEETIERMRIIPTLRDITLITCKVPNAKLLTEFQGLNSISLIEIQLDDFSFLSQFKELKSISIEGSPGSKRQEVDLSILQGLKSLEHIGLTYISIRNLSSLGSLKNLTTIFLLEVSTSDIKGSEIRFDEIFKESKSLSEFNPGRIKDVTSKQIKKFKETLPNCRTL